MTDQVDRELFREYGAVMRRIRNGGFSYTAPDGRICKHWDGWHDSSIAAMAREGGLTGGSEYVQHFDEVHTPNSLAVRIALNRLDDSQRLIFDGIWVLRLSYRNLAKLINLKKSRTAELVMLTEQSVSAFIRGIV